MVVVSCCNCLQDTSSAAVCMCTSADRTTPTLPSSNNSITSTLQAHLHACLLCSSSEAQGGSKVHAHSTALLVSQPCTNMFATVYCCVDLPYGVKCDACASAADFLLYVMLPLLQIAYTTPWIIMLSQLAYYSKIYGPQVCFEVTSATAAAASSSSSNGSRSSSGGSRGGWLTTTKLTGTRCLTSHSAVAEAATDAAAVVPVAATCPPSSRLELIIARQSCWCFLQACLLQACWRDYDPGPSLRLNTTAT